MRSLFTQLDTFTANVERSNRRHHRGHRQPQPIWSPSSRHRNTVIDKALDHDSRRAGGNHRRPDQARGGDRPARQIQRLAADSVNQSKKSLFDRSAQRSDQYWESLANAGPALTPFTEPVHHDSLYVKDNPAPNGGAVTTPTSPPSWT